MTDQAPTKLSRRSFLAAAAVATGHVVLRPAALLAAGEKLPELSFLVVSDTHLGYRDQSHAAEQWEKTAAELAKAPGELVLHLGDVVDGGREAQYPVYLETRKTIGKPVHEIPGNHDPQPLFEKHVRRPVEKVVECRWLRFLLLNDSRTDSHDGFLTEEQLGWMETQLREAERDDAFAALCLHVPVHTNRHPDRGWYVKPENGQRELYEIVRRHRDRLLCLMHGHFHNGVRGWEDHSPVHEIVFPSALYNRDRRLVAQNAPGYNLSEFRPGYTQVTIADGQMRLRYQPVGAAEPAKKSCRLPQLDRGSMAE